MGTMFDGNIASNKKARKSTPKVRSGCVTCKARRVKCDEQKPECQRCLRASRKCEGYPGGGRGLSAQPLPLEPASIAAYSIPFKVPGSQADRQLLHYFCCQAAWNLSSCTDPTLWTELILQRANHQPVIRNALVALSSLHKDYLCGELAGTEYETPTPSTSLAPVANVKTMAVISRCHRQLRNYLARPDASPDVALVCSLIFYTFESLLGESQRAIWHLDQGLILLRKCQLDHSLASDDPLIPHLSTLLHHLDLQASCFDDRRPPLLRLATDAETKGHLDIVPDTFLDLTHAEAVLTKIQNWALHHLVNCVHYRGAGVEELPSESFVERLVLAAQLQKFETVLDRFAYHGSSISHTATHNQREDRRQQRTQRLLLLRVNLHTFTYLVKENLPLLTADASDMAKKVMALLPGYSGRPLPQIVLSGGDTETDLESALASIEALLSQTWPLPDSAATGPETTTSATPARTYTLSTHLIAAIYFLSLKTTNRQILEKATALFSHPQLRHARDGLWDARTAAFLVKNLVRVRQNGDVTEGSDASDILMHIAEQDIGVDIAQLQRIFHMSQKSGLPMMQSKKFTLVLRKGAVVRRHIGQEHRMSSCAYSSTSTSATVKRNAHDVHAPVYGFEDQQHVAGARYTLPTDHLAPMPVPPRRTPSKTGPSRAQGKFGPQTQSEGTANVYPEYHVWNACIHVCSDPCAVFKPEPYPAPAAVITRPFRF
ncbi:hypothetical protein G647_10389 [Cladophialophora carrionii CBS 160.54]|uniref:Zn(2)-C6 fungal-type domain-containing protein n=1 Tax=Cladophialophora carrionii CBS 160.54 TaxID=1279043 RepID=V9DJY3_9EURO|nr:uncharacterized protein G647_10389 [Cladophialophora carrionii CBS 160.54]ETI26628.1 hypothetical protein G647_10389 [Cladophialophora carrionii CBS 160.54]